MSKTQRVIDLVGEIQELESRLRGKREELSRIIGEPGTGSPAPEDGEPGWGDLIVKYLSDHPGVACAASDIREAVGCSDQVFHYHMKGLLDAKRAKRVGRGKYQLRGRR